MIIFALLCNSICFANSDIGTSSDTTFVEDVDEVEEETEGYEDVPEEIEEENEIDVSTSSDVIMKKKLLMW